MTNRNNPKVTIVNGIVKKIKTGRIKVFNNPNTIATSIAVV